jgi:hypothetical protein
MRTEKGIAKREMGNRRKSLFFKILFEWEQQGLLVRIHVAKGARKKK